MAPLTPAPLSAATACSWVMIWLSAAEPNSAVRRWVSRTNSVLAPFGTATGPLAGVTAPRLLKYEMPDEQDGAGCPPRMLACRRYGWALNAPLYPDTCTT